MSAVLILPWMRRAYVRFAVWSRRAGLYRKLAFALTAAAVISGTATLMSWSGTAQTAPNLDTVLALLLIDGILLLLLGAMVSRQLVRVWAERRRGLAGSGLHVRMVLMFSVVAVTPAILVAVFSALFLHFGIQSWFSERVRTAVESSNAVAQAYLREHQQSIRAEAFALAADLDREAPQLISNPRLFSQRVALLSRMRSVPEVVVTDGNGRVLVRSPLSLSLQLDLVPRKAFQQASRGEIVVLTNESQNRVRAVVKLNRFIDAYLLVGKFIDPGVRADIERTESAVAQYRRLEQRREGILISFVLIFVVVALLLLLAAVWTGLTLSTQLTRPISHLIAAADRVRKGDLGARVQTTHSVEEIDTLGRAFNRMTSQLESQRQSLIVANRQLDERRRFTETVLSGVSAGVIGLDRQGLINLPNRSASELVGTDLESAIGRSLKEIVPEMGELVARAVAFPDRSQQAEIRLICDGQPRTLIARMVAEKSRGEVVGYVMTFDDITALVSAQRKAAWADVARRIAHEIKNPLTPIQLAAERLQRRYHKHLSSDPDTFQACTSTIVRRVEDIRRMVDEFSAFARMPRPELKRENLCELIRQAVFLEKTRNPAIHIDVRLPDEEVWVSCDSRQMAQALTNILKNAAEAIVESADDPGRHGAEGRIWVSLWRDPLRVAGEQLEIVVEDNGRGLPEEQRDRLTEPYVTTRAKGTGLGLAIVRKIVEDHHGELILENREGGGARVTMILFASKQSELAGDGQQARREAAGEEVDVTAEMHEDG